MVHTALQLTKGILHRDPRSRLCLGSRSSVMLSKSSLIGGRLHELSDRKTFLRTGQSFALWVPCFGSTLMKQRREIVDLRLDKFGGEGIRPTYCLHYIACCCLNLLHTLTTLCNSRLA